MIIWFQDLGIFITKVYRREIGLLEFQSQCHIVLNVEGDICFFFFLMINSFDRTKNR